MIAGPRPAFVVHDDGVDVVVAGLVDAVESHAGRDLEKGKHFWRKLISFFFVNGNKNTKSGKPPRRGRKRFSF